jgi:hypothetical protein
MRITVIRGPEVLGLRDAEGKRLTFEWARTYQGVPVTVGYWIAYHNPVTGISSEMRHLDTVTVPSNETAVVIDLLPHGYSGGVGVLEVWRARAVGTVLRWDLVAEVDADDGHVVVDTGRSLRKLELAGGDRPRQPRYLLYESGLRWSEPYQPNWIREDSFMEVRAGDGEHITGLAVLYGNLLVFKENSIVRLAVQNSGPVPISRVDEVANDVGCIAPNTLISVRNTIFFLSWSGLMMYDNNVIRNVDQKVHPELMWLLRNAPIEDIRCASCGYDPVNDELLLYIPTRVRPPRWYDRIDRTVRNPWAEINGPAPVAQQEAYRYELSGNVFVFKLNTGFVSKYLYSPYEWSDNSAPWNRPVFGPRRWPGVVDIASGRLWYTDKVGVLWGAEIGVRNPVLDRVDWAPPATVYMDNFADTGEDEYIHYIDSPTTQSAGWVLVARPIAWWPKFPVISRQLIYSYARSKEWVADDKTASKRVRRYQWQFYQPRGITIAQPISSVIRWLGRRGTVYRQGILFNAIDGSSELGAQVWLLAQTRRLDTSVTSLADERFDQGAIGWAIGVWVPPNEGMEASSSTVALVPPTSTDPITKPYRWSSVIETIGRAVVNGATIWWRPYADWLR